MITIGPVVTDLTSLLNTGEDCSAKKNAAGTCLKSLATYDVYQPQCFTYSRGFNDLGPGEAPEKSVTSTHNTSTEIKIVE